MGANQRRYLHARAGEWSGRQRCLGVGRLSLRASREIDQMVQAGYQAASQAGTGRHVPHRADAVPETTAAREHRGTRPRLAGVLIVLGDSAEAEKLMGSFHSRQSSVRLLRSELAFVRGDFDGALAEAEMALIGNSAERVKVSSAWPTWRFTWAISVKRSVTAFGSRPGQHLRCQPARPLLRHRGRHRNTLAATSRPPRPDSVLPWNSWRACPKPTATA